MLYVLLGLVLFAAIYAPQFWAKHVLKKYSVRRDDFPGTGSELAQHFIERYQIDGVQVEKTDRGDHYSPADKMVRLSPDNFDGKSLTAIAVAAHEVGHAIQDHIAYQPLLARTKLVNSTWLLEKLGAFLLVSMPFVAALTRIPSVGFLMMAAGILALGTQIIVHLVTLPVEFDASFKCALPLLEQGYIDNDDQHAVRKILLACALTYVAASLAGLLNLWRWIVILRR